MCMFLAVTEENEPSQHSKAEGSNQGKWCAVLCLWVHGTRLFHIIWSLFWNLYVPSIHILFWTFRNSIYTSLWWIGWIFSLKLKWEIGASKCFKVLHTYTNEDFSIATSNQVLTVPFMYDSNDEPGYAVQYLRVICFPVISQMVSLGLVSLLCLTLNYMFVCMMIY